ncbi:MAG: hypothetical protein ACXVLT_05350, partial [Flavisolibacter sp.]
APSSWHNGRYGPGPVYEIELSANILGKLGEVYGFGSQCTLMVPEIIQAPTVATGREFYQYCESAKSNDDKLHKNIRDFFSALPIFYFGCL